MNQSRMVHYAVACLEGLDIPLAPRDLSRSQKVPFEDCLHILEQFEAAGLVRKNAKGLVERNCSIEELTALEVLQALWRAPSCPNGARTRPLVDRGRGTGHDIRMLFGTKEFNADQVARLASRAGAWPRG